MATVTTKYYTVNGQIRATSSTAVYPNAIYLPDAIGNVTETLTATTAATPLVKNRFRGYGETAYQAAGVVGPRFGFNGALGVARTGRQSASHKMGDRYFDAAQQARFITRVKEQFWLGGESVYGFALSNPIGNSDPSGNNPLNSSDFQLMENLLANPSGLPRGLLIPCIKQLQRFLTTQGGTVQAGAIRRALACLGTGKYNAKYWMSHGAGIKPLWYGPKCNYMVADMYALGGGMGYSNEDVTGFPVCDAGSGYYRPYVSNELYDIGKGKGDCFRVLCPTKNPQIGDIVVFPDKSGSGHTTLKLCDGLLIYAGNEGCKVGTFDSNRHYEKHGAPAFIRVCS